MIYNTLSGKKERFEPLEEGCITMYVCGVTVYDECHVGHARALVVFDVIRRFLEHLGYKVDCVRNFTDVDDKIIKRANEEGTTCAEVASRYIRAFNEDVGRLGLLKPSREPRATEHITDMLKLVSTLVEKGHAYEVDGDVFFAVSSFGEYGKLSGKDPGELRAGARVEVDDKKRNPLDFALWKKSKPGEPSWESPWGRGRPGWHIECSAMIRALLGETIDIHGGGQDLIFPHHENEIAQSESCTGRKPFVRYWLHNGHVTIRDEKMSKSLGNFFTLKQIYAEYEPRVLHFFLISKHYRSPLDFSKAGLSEAREALKRIDNCLGMAENALAEKGWPSSSTKHHPFNDIMDRFNAGMCDDFNTLKALSCIFETVIEINNILVAPHDAPLLRRRYEELKSMCKVLNIQYGPPQPKKIMPKDIDRERMSSLMGKLGLQDDEIDDLIAYRLRLRELKEYDRADEIRKILEKFRIPLRDGPGNKYTLRMEGIIEVENNRN